jgi:hypothetical protein
MTTRLAVAALVAAFVAGAAVATVLDPDDVDGRRRGQKTPSLPAATYSQGEVLRVEDPEGVGTIVLSCDDGDVLLSGGFNGLESTSRLVTNGPVTDGTWEVSWRNGGRADGVAGLIRCADLAPRRAP